MNCPVCYSSFDLKDHIPIVGECGHSVCSYCAEGRQCGCDRIGAHPCPFCGREKMFTKFTQNYQLTDVLKVLNDSARKKENEVKKVASLPKCHICSANVDENKARICRPCCLEENMITVNEDHSVSISDIKKVDASVMCASCFLEGAHEGHKSLILLPVKLRFSAATKYGELREEVQKINTKSFDSGIEEMKNIVKSFDRPLKRLQSIGHMVGSSEELDGILNQCKRQKTALDELEEDFDLQVEEYTVRLKEIYHELNLAAQNPAIVLPDVLEVLVPDVCSANGNLEVKLLNKSKADFVTFLVCKQPSVCKVVVPSNTIHAGGNVVLLISLRTGREEEKENGNKFSLTIKYFLTGEPSENAYASFTHTIAVPFKFP